MALVTDGNALPCIMPDIEIIAKIVTYYERWQVWQLNSRSVQTSPGVSCVHVPSA